MANDEKFTVPRGWTPVQLNGKNITEGIFSVFAITPDPIGFIKSNTQPAEVNQGVAIFRKAGDSFKYNLEQGEFLYAQSLRGPIAIGVVPA